MAKGGHKRYAKRKNTARKNLDDENSRSVKNRAIDRKKHSRKNRSLVRQMRGMKWNEDEYGEELEELEDTY